MKAFIRQSKKRLSYKYFIFDVNLIRKRFTERLGRDVALDNPVKFNNKLQWVKFDISIIQRFPSIEKG